MINPEYLVECPYCFETVRIQHVMSGVWAISPDNPNCDACLRFVFRVSNIFDTTETDEEIDAFLNLYAE